MIRRLLGAFFGLLFLVFAGVAPAAAKEGRVALVIGNSAYQYTLALPNPVNDARLLRDTLAKLGFDVIYRENLGKAEMERAISAFAGKLRAAGPSSVALFYYAGHGMQSGGENYLLPIDAKLEREADLRFSGVRAGDVLAQMEAAQPEVKIVILDACRNNPFANTFGAAAPRGLADIGLGNTEFFVAYAATAGNVAMDGGDGGSNSPYAAALARRLGTPNSEISNTFRLVRVDVSSATRDRQLPEARTTMRQQFFFNLATAAHPPDAAPLPPTTLLAHAAVSASSVYGRWCDSSRSSGVVLEMNSGRLTYIVGGQRSGHEINQIAPRPDGKVEVQWDNGGAAIYLEFGEFSADEMTQLRGKQGAGGGWKNYDIRFRRCS